MSLYSLDLVNLETSQLNLQKGLTEGSFSVNSTGKLFAGVPANIALEQTINANAETMLNDIMTFADISTTIYLFIYLFIYLLFI